MRPGPRSVFNYLLESIALDAPPEPLDNMVFGIIEEHGEWNCEPAEKAEEWREAVYRLLQQDYGKSLAQGRQPRFAFNSSSPYMVEGACFVEPSDSEPVRQQKLNRLHWQEYYRALKDLDPRRFEILCTKVLHLLGVPEPKLTPYQGDEGIDFYGQMSIGDLVGHGPLFPVFETRLPFWLVGQAKHYLHTKVATPDIRELVGAIVLGRARAFSNVGIYPTLTIRACDPVVVLFFTTGQISADGWALCNSSGVAAMDGEMLAAFLADKGVAIQMGSGTESFQSALFDTWLRS